MAALPGANPLVSFLWRMLAFPHTPSHCRDPRAQVLERFWRLEEDGTIIINLQSINHSSAEPEPTSSFCNYAPVRMDVMGGVTISPLRPEFAAGMPAEAYVTNVRGAAVSLLHFFPPPCLSFVEDAANYSELLHL